MTEDHGPGRVPKIPYEVRHVLVLKIFALNDTFEIGIFNLGTKTKEEAQGIPRTCDSRIKEVSYLQEF